jgi:hypothetical protein
MSRNLYAALAVSYLVLLLPVLESVAPALLAQEPQPAESEGQPAVTQPSLPAVPTGPTAWGIAGIHLFPYGERTGPNGAEYNQLFSLDLDLNLWLWREQRVYLFAESEFWGQKPGPGITNPSQGSFDFSKREFDYDLGLAWNVYGPFEARVFAYSFNNLNRGSSATSPSGFNDGVGLEGRYYLPSGTYSDLGSPDFDLARATFVSAGYFPTKDVVGTTGKIFKPGPFARAYLTYDLYGEKCYLFTDAEVIGLRDGTPKLLDNEAGVAVRPILSLPNLEFRVGVENAWDIQVGDVQTSLYGACRVVF